MAVELYIRGERTGHIYRGVRKLGSGDWGSVYHVRKNQRSFACKIPHPGEEVNRRIIEKEAAIQAEVTHPAVTPIVVFDRTKTRYGTTPFIIMPLAATDLKRYIRDRGALPPKEAYRLSLQSAQAIQSFHAKGIVVSDIQPANILFFRRPNGEMQGKLADFGGAAHIDNPFEEILGSDNYVAPEFDDAAPNVLLDQYAWAAGAVHPSFTGRLGSPRAFALDVSSQMSYIHAVVEPVAYKARHPNPGGRYASMEELIDELESRKIKAEEWRKKQRTYL